MPERDSFRAPGVPASPGQYREIPPHSNASYSPFLQTLEILFGPTVGLLLLSGCRFSARAPSRVWIAPESRQLRSNRESTTIQP